MQLDNVSSYFQVDQSCLAALPADLRLEFERAYAGQSSHSVSEKVTAQSDIHPLMRIKVGCWLIFISCFILFCHHSIYTGCYVQHISYLWDDIYILTSNMFVKCTGKCLNCLTHINCSLNTVIQLTVNWLSSF